jgi:hypothetical protein
VNAHSTDPLGNPVIKLGEWVVYNSPYKGEVLANVQAMCITGSFTELEMPHHLDGEGKTCWHQSFRAKLLMTKPTNWTGMISTGTNSNRLRILTEEEERDLDCYFKGDFPLLINKPLIKEFARQRLKTGTRPVLDKGKFVTPFL